MSRILITGAAGFIGSQLAYKLYKEGHDLILVDNMSYGHEDNLTFEDDDIDLNNILVECDIRDKAKMQELFKSAQFDYVYNIAGIAPLPDCQSNPCEAIDVNINGFVNVLELSRIYGVKTVIQASTNAMYENETIFPVNEHFTQMPSLIYPNTKYCAERFAQSYCDTYNMNVCCVRFANVYGPHVDCLRKQPPFVGYIIRELYYNRTPVFHSDGNQSRDYIYVDDLTDLLLKVQSCKGFDVVNCTSAKSYSVREIYDITQKIMHKNIPAEYTSTSNYWKKYPQLYGGAYPISEERLEHEVNKYSLCSNTYALGKYDWSPKTDMETGMKYMVDYQVKLFDRIERKL